MYRGLKPVIDDKDRGYYESTYVWTSGDVAHRFSGKRNDGHYARTDGKLSAERRDEILSMIDRIYRR